MPLISLVVPFYNEIRHLHRCISSILSQSFDDFEVLMVDDLSTDGSFALVEKLTAGDSRFRLMHSDAKGLFHARNKALSEAHGQYICFLDADDELLPDYLLGLYQDSQIEPVDLVIQGYSHVFADHCDDYHVNTPGYYKLLPVDNTDPSRADYSLFSAFDLVSMAHIPGKLYLKQLIDQHRLRFSEYVLICEDMFFFLSYLRVCRKVYLSTKSNYHYISNGNSMTSSYWNFDVEERSYLEMLKIWEQVFSLYDYPSLRTGYGAFIGSYVHRLIISSLFHPDSVPFKNAHLNKIKRAYLPLYRTDFVPCTLFTRLLKFTALHSWFFAFAVLYKMAILRYHLQVNFR